VRAARPFTGARLVWRTEHLNDHSIVNEQLVGGEDRVEERLEAERRLGLVAQLTPDQCQALALQAAGHSHTEITTRPGASERKLRRDTARERKVRARPARDEDGRA